MRKRTAGKPFWDFSRKIRAVERGQVSGSVSGWVEEISRHIIFHCVMAGKDSNENSLLDLEATSQYSSELECSPVKQGLQAPQRVLTTVIFSETHANGHSLLIPAKSRTSVFIEKAAGRNKKATLRLVASKKNRNPLQRGNRASSALRTWT